MRKFSLTIFSIFGLVMLYASQSWAGSLGNGAAQWNKFYGNKAAPAAPQAHYSFCLAERRGPKIVYFSAVMTWAPSLTLPNPDHPFSSYLTKTYGVVAGVPACRTGLSKDDVVALKKQQDTAYVSRKWKIVETNWAAAGVASAPSSSATPPAASANAQTSPPPAAQAVTDTAKAQVSGQIEQAGQNVLNKLFHP